MDYKAKKAESLRGPATVRVMRNTIQVKFSDDVPGKGASYSPGRTYEVKKSDAPEVVLAGEYWVAMNGNGTILYAESPISGRFNFRFVEWRHKPDQIPEPRYDPGGRQAETRDGRQFTTRASLSMDAICEIVDGSKAGLTCLFMQPYPYVEDEDTGKAVAELGATALEKLKLWDQCVGLDDLDIKYEKNLLPALAKIITKKGKVFQGEVNGGLIRSVALPADGYKPPKIKARK